MPQKPLVLIAEDDHQLRELLELSLLDRYRLSLVEDGLQAVECVQREAPDLILMDIKMPKLDGWGAIQEIRSRGFTTPIIVMTGFSDCWNEMNAQRLGVKKYVSKPFSIPQLRELIHEEILSAQG